MLAEETPASFVAFDLLADGDDDLRALPFPERRARLEAALAEGAGRRCTSRRPPPTAPPRHEWFERFEGAGLDGVVAKPLDGHYEEGKRTMLKVKHQRTADCVVGGFRVHKDGAGVGSLLLGLYDDDGVLHHVGVASSFAARGTRRELLDELAPYREARSTRTRGGSGPRRTADSGPTSGQRRPGRAEPLEPAART